MAEGRSLRRWMAVHKWTSLICTLVLLVLCVTGLPLVFHEDIDRWLGDHPLGQGGGATATVESVVAVAQAAFPGEVPQFVVWEENKPGIVTLSMARSATADPAYNHNVYVDVATLRVVAAGGVMDVVLRLHAQLLLGPYGPLPLGLMAILFLISLISGIVIYAPFMRRLVFGTVRFQRSARVRWLDIHNLLGIVVAAWMIIVGFTGLLNSWGNTIIQIWRADQLGAIIADYKEAPAPAQIVSPDGVLARARAEVPHMAPYFIAYPGSTFASARHYGVFFRGDTTLTSRILKPVLIDAETSQVTATLELPWYVKSLLLSQPLHFGDYGGLPLKLLWAVMDVITIIVLISGPYLWIARASSATEGAFAEGEEAASP